LELRTNVFMSREYHSNHAKSRDVRRSAASDNRRGMVRAPARCESLLSFVRVTQNMIRPKTATSVEHVPDISG
jgi:hypothetical protein